jgi:Tol biopolymer transport system component
VGQSTGLLVVGLAFVAGGCRQLLGLDEPRTADAFAWDAAIDGQLASWNPPVASAFLGAALGDMQHPSLSPDMLEVYFDRNRDILTSTRSAIADAWRTPAVVMELSTASVETTPELAPDGNTLAFASDRAGTLGGDDLWIATRGPGGIWQGVVQATVLSSTSNDTGGAFTTDHLAVALASDRANGIDTNLYLATRPDTATAWSISELTMLSATGRDDGNPYLSPDGLTLYFDSDRLTGKSDLFVATRTDRSAEFTSVKAISELDTMYNEQAPWVSADGHHIYFSSDRSGTYAIYEASR